MKCYTRNFSLAILLLASSIAATSTPVLAQSSISSTKTDAVATQAPTNAGNLQDAKAVEAFADPVFAEIMKKYNVSGSNFVVVKDGKVIVNKGYGYANKEKKIPVTPQTVFQIASVSKTFTALAAMQMVDQGKINLNHNIDEYLGGIKIPNKTGKPLTMFDMLTYTSGVDLPDITTFVSPEYINQDIPTKDFLKKHLPTVVRPPGESYVYDNYGFLLAGYAVENVSGLRFDKYMEQNVFMPLGMNSTSVRFTPELLSRMAEHYSVAGDPQPTNGHAPTDGPQGSILSTGDDMANYLIMQLQNGKFGDKQIVSPESIDLMHTYQTFADDNKTIPIATVGFEGYYQEKMNGQHVVLKGGNMPGHSSLIVLLPEKNTGIYMSYNNDTNMSIDIYDKFMDEYFPEETKSPQPAYTKLSEKDAKAYIGLYKNTRAFGIRTSFTYENGHLMMEDETTGKHTLNMVTPLIFEDEAHNKVAFKKDSKGNIRYSYYTSTIGLGVVAHAQKMDTPAAFSDVPASSKYATYINNLHALDVMNAKIGNYFVPKGTITQGEFADILIQAHGWSIFPGQAEGIKKDMIANIPGYNRAKLITRQVAAVMIQNLKHAPEATNVKLSGSTDAFAVKSISALVGQGIVDPDTTVNKDGSIHFRSKELLLRQEASALLDKAFGYYALPLKIK